MELILESQATWTRVLNTDDKIIGVQPAELANAKGKYISFRDAARMTKRDLGSTKFSTGGALTQMDIDREVIEYLRNKSVLLKAGATLMQNVMLPRGIAAQLSNPTGQWLAEGVAATPQDFLFDQRLLQPHRLTVHIRVSNLLGIQAAPDFDAVVADAAQNVLWQAVDAAGLSGTSGVQPIGLLNLAGTGEVIFGGTATWNKITTFENALENANVPDDGTVAWLVAPDTATKWKQTLRAGNSARYIMDDDGRVNGQKSFQTTELSTTNQVVYVKASDIVIATLGAGFYLLKNPYTSSDTGETRFTATMWVDLAARHAQSVCISMDAGNQ